MDWQGRRHKYCSGFGPDVRYLSTMAIFNPAKLLTRMMKPGAAAKVAEELGGEKALQALLAQAGYAGKPKGLSERFFAELKACLPLCLDQATQRAFGSFFEGSRVMAAARREAAALPRPDEEPDLRPASQIKPEAEEVDLGWALVSGQAAARLAQAGLAGADGELAMDALRAMDRTAKRYPPLMGLGWAREGWLAIRAANWLLAFRFLAEKGPADPEAVVRCVLHLKVAGLVLEQRLESSGGDYSAGDVPAAGALLLLGKALAFLPRAKSWRRMGAKALGPSLMAWDREGAEQNLPPVSQACQWGGLCLWLGMKNNLKLTGVVAGLQKLAAMCRALAPPWADGSTWGRASEGRVWDLEHGMVDPFTAASNLAALLVKEPSLRAGRVLGQGLYWLFGKETYESLRQLAGGAQPGAVGLAGARIAAIGAQCGSHRVGLQLNLLSSHEGPASGALALFFSLDGQPVLQRPGPAPGGPLAGYLGSRAAHNTLVIDKQDPGTGSAAPEGIDLGTGHAFISASFDGYIHMADPVILRRRVFLDLAAGVVTVVDQIQSKAEHLCQVFFHLSPEAELIESGQGDVLIQGPFGKVVFLPDSSAVLNRAKGITHPPLGWRCGAGGQAEPSHSLVVGANIVGRVSLTNTFKII